MVDETLDTEVLVIGAGSGGYTAAIRAGQSGLETMLVEKDTVGGTCIGRGCIPSKALITSLRSVNRAANGANRGIFASPAIDLKSMIEWKDGVVGKLTGGIRQLCRSNGVEIVEGRAKFVSPTDARIERNDGSSVALNFDHAVVATGSRPKLPPDFEFDGETIMNSAQILDLTRVPRSLLIVGTGYIGMELAFVFQELGTSVTVVGRRDRILPGYEPDVSEVVKSHAKASGIAIHTEEEAYTYSYTPDGIQVSTRGYSDEGRGDTYEAEKSLIAIGRVPVTDTMNINAAGLKPNDQGYLDTDEQMNTAQDNIYAVGDVAGEPMLAHKATREAHVAVDNITGQPMEMNYATVPAAVFTTPEVSIVGLTEAEADALGYETVVGEKPFRTNGRALTFDEPDGFVRIVADDEDGSILGAQIVGADASELISELTLAMELGGTLEDIYETTHVHPTLSEAVMEAAANAHGRAIHVLNEPD